MDESEEAPEVYKTRSADSTRWQAYRPRRRHVVIATYPKCGTTRVQRGVKARPRRRDDRVQATSIARRSISSGEP